MESPDQCGDACVLCLERKVAHLKWHGQSRWISQCVQHKFKRQQHHNGSEPSQGSSCSSLALPSRWNILSLWMNTRSCHCRASGSPSKRHAGGSGTTLAMSQRSALRPPPRARAPAAPARPASRAATRPRMPRRPHAPAAARRARAAAAWCVHHCGAAAQRALRHARRNCALVGRQHTKLNCDWVGLVAGTCASCTAPVAQRAGKARRSRSARAPPAAAHPAPAPCHLGVTSGQ